jgi:hypothetical protein
MYWNDHEPGHFHALLAEHRAAFDIETLTLTDGYLPRPKLQALLRWAAPRKSELWKAWHNTQARQPPGPIR